MKHLKLFFLASLVMLSFGAKAQDASSKGFTVQVLVGSYLEGGETKTYDVNDIYNVSIKDQVLIHNVLDLEGLVTDSQVYKISDLKVETVEGITSFKFNATSGVSGKVYGYYFSFISSMAMVDRTQPDGFVESFVGTSVVLKTFKQ